MAVAQSVVRSADAPDGLAEDQSELTQWFNTFRNHAGSSFVSVILSGLLTENDSSKEESLSGENEDESRLMMQCMIFGLFSFMAFGLVMRPALGLLAILAYSLQPLLIFGDSPLHIKDQARYLFGRFPADFIRLVRLLFFRRQEPSVATQQLRNEYTALLAEGTDRFFNRRRETCPFCGSTELKPHITSRDFLQQKPGLFRLERCKQCRYVFQNPSLSEAGLNFYYKDFYDGLSGDLSESVLSMTVHKHFDQARMLKGLATPLTWLDVGAGYGHFSVIARQVWPKTRMDGLDIGQSIRKAKTRGWIDRCYNDNFSNAVPSFEGKYDVISMIHYLEHTADPKAEIETAASALSSKGHLLIELPNPEHGLSTLLGQFWLPWFQPQHLNFPAAAHLTKWLNDAGFDLVKSEFDRVHQEVDFLFASIFFLKKTAPFDHPWSTLKIAPWRRSLTWMVGLPLLVLARILDKVYARFFAKGEKRVNNYRLLAVKRD